MYKHDQLSFIFTFIFYDDNVTVDIWW